MYCKVIHKYFNEIFNEFREDAYHTPLKHTRCVTKPKRHPPVGECSEWAGECGLLLVLWLYGHLKIPGVSIEETVIRVTYKAFKHLIYKGKREVILTCYRV